MYTPGCCHSLQWWQTLGTLSHYLTGLGFYWVGSFIKSDKLCYMKWKILAESNLPTNLCGGEFLFSRLSYTLGISTTWYAMVQWGKTGTVVLLLFLKRRLEKAVTTITMQEHVYENISFTVEMKNASVILCLISKYIILCHTVKQLIFTLLYPHWAVHDSGMLLLLFEWGHSPSFPTELEHMVCMWLSGMRNQRLKTGYCECLWL